jgi:hypothetical protein
MKKGQVTIFIIIGIVVLIVLGLVLYLRSSMQDYAPTQDLKKQATNPMNDCMESRAKDGLFLIGIHGGTISNGPYNNLSYAVKGGNKVLITEEDMKKELEQYVESKLAECTQDASEKLHLNITPLSSSAVATLGKKTYINMPKAYEVKGQGSTATGDINIELDIALEQAYKTAWLIADQYLQDGRFREQTLPVSILDMQDAYMVIITVPKSDIMLDTDYRFAFALEK